MGAAGLGLFGTTQANAQSTFQTYKPEISGVTNIFGYNGITYGLWPDKKITSEEGKTYFLKENKWVSESGEIMPIEFNQELEKSANAINLKAKENNSRIVDYFTFFHSPSKQKNTIVVYSDGTAALGNFIYDFDKQGAFYDENRNSKRDPKEQGMGEGFTKLYYEKLKSLVKKQGLISKWIFPPLSERERLDMALQVEDYEDFLSHDEIKAEVRELRKKYDEKFQSLNKDIDLLKITDDQNAIAYDDSALKGMINEQGKDIQKNSEKISELEVKLNEYGLSEKSANKVYIENSYDDSKVKENISSLYKEIEELKVALIGVSEFNQSTQNTNYSALEGKIKALDEKICGLEKITSLDKGNIIQYDDSKIREDISQIKKQLEILKPFCGNETTQEQKQEQYQQHPEQKQEEEQEYRIDKPSKINLNEEGLNKEELNKNCKTKPHISQIIRTPGLSFSVGPEIYFDSDGNEGAALNLGIRYDIDKMFGLGINTSIGGSPNKVIESYNETLNPSTGRYAQGKITNTNRMNFGVCGEVRVGPVILGGGAEFESGIKSTLEQIIESGVELSSNTSAIDYFLNRAKFYAGLDIPLTQNLGIKVYGGVLSGLTSDPNKCNFYGGVNGTIKLGNKNEKGK